MRPHGTFVGVTEADDDAPPTPPLSETQEAEARAASVAEESLPPMHGLSLTKVVRKVTDGPNGGEMSSHHALRLALDVTSFASESSRVARSRGAIKSGTEVRGDVSMTVGEPEPEISAKTDPLLVLVTVKNYGVTPALVMPESFTNPQGISSSTIKRSEFDAPGTTGTGYVMTNLKFGSGVITWKSGGLGVMVTKFDCTHAVTLNPKVSILDLNSIFTIQHQYQLNPLETAANAL